MRNINSTNNNNKASLHVQSDLYSRSNISSMKSVIVTGANRGIGFGLVKQLLATKAEHLFATYRQADRSKVSVRVCEGKTRFLCLGVVGISQAKFFESHSASTRYLVEIFDWRKQSFERLDITDDASIQKAAEKVQQTLNGKDLNCLINNAGTAAKLKFGDINEKDMMETYRQNVIGPWKVMKVRADQSFFVPWE